MRVLFKSHNLIGDALYISPALRAWIKEKDKTEEKNSVIIYLQTLPDHVAPLYVGMVRDFLLDGDNHCLAVFKTVFERPEGKFDFEHTFDVSAAFKLSDDKKQHLAKSYADMLGVEINSLKPVYIPEDEVRENLRGSILISAFSASCQSRDKNVKGLPPNKMLPFAKWKPLMSLIRHEYPETKIRFLGAPSDMFPNGYMEGIVNPGEYMLGIPLNRLALIMKKVRLVVTIDNGMSHLAASQETPTFLMYPRCLAPHYILPIGNPNLQWVHMEPSQVNPAQLRFTLEQAIRRFKAQEEAHGSRSS